MFQVPCAQQTINAGVNFMYAYELIIYFEKLVKIWLVKMVEYLVLQRRMFIIWSYKVNSSDILKSLESFSSNSLMHFCYIIPF